MQAKMIITVTSTPQRGTFEMPANASAADIRLEVRRRFGMQTASQVWALPHNYCGRIEPPPAVEPSLLTGMFAYGSSRGHLRVV